MQGETKKFFDKNSENPTMSEAKKEAEFGMLIQYISDAMPGVIMDTQGDTDIVFTYENPDSDYQNRSESVHVFADTNGDMVVEQSHLDQEATNQLLPKIQEYLNLQK